jgi:diaminopimelate epimerase
MRFAKGHGTENDFVILLDPDGRDGLTGDLAARLCDRRAGIGADGVLRVIKATAMAQPGVPAGRPPGPAQPGVPAGRPPGPAQPGVPAGRPPGPAQPNGTGAAAVPEWFMDYRNADGGAVEMCGNGIRVFARYLVEHGLAEGPEFTVATRSGPHLVRLDPGGDVTVDMGHVAMHGPGRAVVGGQPCEGLRVSVGNPHLACLVDAPLASFDLSAPPELDPEQFPEGANVELVQVTGPRRVAMRVRERGSGETRSCGTGAVAAAAAAATLTGQGDGAWSVTVPGGELIITLAGSEAWLTGPAVIVAEGDLDPAWLAAQDRIPSPS